jgi:hypothetical protein
MMTQVIDVQAYIPPEDHLEIGLKHVVGKNKKLLILDSCVDSTI